MDTTSPEGWSRYYAAKEAEERNGEYVSRLEEKIADLHGDIVDRDMEIKRLRWVLDARLNHNGEHTMLHDYDEVNPKWFDAQLYGYAYPLPPFYKENSGRPGR